MDGCMLLLPHAGSNTRPAPVSEVYVVDLRACFCWRIGEWVARAICLGAILGCLAAETVRAGSVSTTQCFDTFINNGYPGNNNGGDTTFFTGVSGQGNNMRGLIGCTLPSAIDSRATVTQVTLTLTTAGLGTTGTTPPTAATESLYPVAQSWGEGNKVGNTTGTYVVGQACTSGEATWNQSQCSISNWTTAGGTVSGGVSASASSPGSIGASVVFSSLGGGMVVDVENWANSPSNNYGWLVLSSSSVAGQAQRYSSHEASSGVPQLAITYGCKSGFQDTGNGCTACTSSAQAACVNSQPGNSCMDPGAPSSYSCVCGNVAYTGTGTQACTDLNECTPNHCVDGGDSGAVCADHIAPATGYDCTCDAGFVFDGMTCTDRIFADNFEVAVP